MRLHCPHCQRTLEVPDSAAGKQVRCPACSTTTRAPELNTPETPPASAPPESRQETAATPRKPLYSRPPASSPLAQPTSSESSRTPASQHEGRERIACPKCGKMLLVTPMLANQIVACPACHSRMRMPSLADARRGVSAKMAFGVGMGAEVRKAAATASDAPAPSDRTGTNSEESPAPGNPPTFPWGQTSPPAVVPPSDAAARDPYMTPVGTARTSVAAPYSGHTEPILYILPGAFQLTFAAITFVAAMVGFGGMAIEWMDGGGRNNLDDVWSLVSMVVSIITTIIIIVGSIQMIRRRSLGLARAAAILAILPCNVCCAVLIPFGIWSTIVLFLPNAANDFS